MKSLVVQINIKPETGECQKKFPSTFSYVPSMYEASNDSVRQWCAKWGYDYHLITESKFPHPTFDKFQIWDIEGYDQFMYVDSDMFFHEWTPDLLQWTSERPEEFFAGMDGSKDDSKSYQKHMKLTGTGFYFNAGFFVIKRSIIDRTFDWISEGVDRFLKTTYKDQNTLNWMMKDEPIYRLSKNWNSTLAQKGPLFTTHYATMRKDQWSPENQRKLDLYKMSQLNEIPREEWVKYY